MSMPPGPADLANPKRVARRTKERVAATAETAEITPRKRGGGSVKTRARQVEPEPAVTAAAAAIPATTTAKPAAKAKTASGAAEVKTAAPETLAEQTHLPTNMPKDPEPTFATQRPAPAGDRTTAGGAAGANAGANAGLNTNAVGQPVAPVTSPRSLLKEAEEKLSLLRDNREIFEWILEKQSSLRTEFVGFLKKDLREIDYVVSDINTQGEKGDFAANALELIKNTYIKHWERSFELISPENVLQRREDER